MLWTEPLVICGFGVVGATVARLALTNGRPPHQVTVVEQDTARARRAEALGHRVITSDATLAPTLRSAGAGVAANIIICIGDEGLVNAIKAARAVAPQAAIQAVLNRSGEEEAAMAAGAHIILSLSKITGQLLAHSALDTPTDQETAKTR